MAVCEFCNEEMRMRLPCTLPAYDDFADDKMRMRIPHDRHATRPCADCMTPPGGFHHPGCEIETCPKCQGLAMACACTSIDEEHWAETG